MGNARPQLEAHIVGGLNIGLTREEIVEIIMQMAAYAGIPAAVNGLMAARKAFQTFDGRKP
jgi:4-carboxymuconolactone decarboxylase